ncbi:hypothetical protein B0T21DRAFT_382932 [Apiosordaria backusii]|uniref:Uncharacterized protein n=1 Tax=Apiosordaria backusii TaxID=314023 RepID=A0AA40BM91_9PEZI|nr:hypothetical protein B0T21DRAFT_382932 [Apiosordaria backusii]
MDWTTRESRRRMKQPLQKREDGMFLLKYASRDEVELLGQGSGGIVEIRNNIAEYTEKSPLYGYLRYRRRNVIIKYLPEDCSRLVQARVTVHFDSVCDRFSPHDTVFEITEAKELKDTKLSAACSLHAASGSTSSSTSSLRRRRLMEIAEEEEEEERDRKRQSTVREEDRPGSSGEYALQPPVKLNADLATIPDASRFTDGRDPPQFTGVERPSSPAQSFDEAGRRMSSQSSRLDLYSSSSYPYPKPKVRLGPRPSAESAGRPQTAGGGTSKPVASMPSSVKALSKVSKKGRSPEDEDILESPIKEEPENAFPDLAPADAGNKPAEDDSVGPPTSNGIPTPVPTPMPTATLAPPPSKPNTISPEKARLLKAMKLREKKKMMSSQSTEGLSVSETPSVPSTTGPAEDNNLEASTTVTLENNPAPEVVLGEAANVDKADSGIEIEIATDQASVDAQTDSHPPSPLASSDIGDSTQASSLSDSTDETVIGKEQEKVTPTGPLSSNKTGKTDSDGPKPDAQPLDGQADSTMAPLNDKSTVVEDKNTAELEEPVAANTAVVEEPPVQALPVSRFSVAVFPTGVSKQDAGSPDSTGTVKEEFAATSPETVPTAGKQEESSPIRLPLSRFSTQDAKPIANVESQIDNSTGGHPSGVGPETADNKTTEAQPVQDVGNTATTETEEATTRKLAPEPIKTRLDASVIDKRRSVISIFDNDGFIDELQSATVQQATPITVSKSPITPFFPDDANSKRNTVGGLDAVSRFPRTVSNPVRSSLLSPNEAIPGSPRSVSSGAYMQKAPRPSADVLPKTGKIGSSISERIKALQQLSGKAGGPADTVVAKERPSSTFFAVRKDGKIPSRTPSLVDRTASLTGRPTPSPPGSIESSPDGSSIIRRDRSGSVVNRLSMFEGGMPPRGRPDSVQVTARIVRDPTKGSEHKLDPAEYNSLELKHSPLMVDLQKRVSCEIQSRPLSALSGRVSLDYGPQIERKQSLLQRRLSKGSQSEAHEREQAADDAQGGLRPRRRSSLTVVKDFIKGAKSPSTDNLAPSPGQAISPGSRSSSRPPSTHQNTAPSSGFARRLSISSRRSSIDQNGVLSPIRTTELAVDSEGESSKKNGSNPTSPNQGKGSRTSRFMRRLSNTLVPNSRKAGPPSISPTVTEENAAEVAAASRASTATSAASPAQASIVAFMGDVNVQFPDNLLWKRRSICLDSQGFLILSAVSGTAMMPTNKNKTAGLLKRYHITDFKPPYTPDVELQELPNSVVLDFVEGSGLQVACEDRSGQMNILNILTEAYQSHCR